MSLPVVVDVAEADQYRGGRDRRGAVGVTTLVQPDHADVVAL